MNTFLVTTEYERGSLCGKRPYLDARYYQWLFSYAFWREVKKIDVMKAYLRENKK